MERIVLFLALGAFLTGSIYTVSVERNSMDADDALNQYHYQELSREAALAGLRLAVRRLAENSANPWLTPETHSIPSTPYREGRYEVDIRLVGARDTADVFAIGVYGPDTTRIDARYYRALDNDGVPPAFRSVILTDSQIELNGNISILTLDPTQNANIHTNGTLTTNGNAFIVDGYGTYSLDGGGQTSQPDNFRPSVDYNGAEPNVLQIPEIAIPNAIMDPSERTLRHSAHNYVLSSNNNNNQQVIDVRVMGDTYCSGPPNDPNFNYNHCRDDNGDGLWDLGREDAFVLWVDGGVELQNVQVRGNLVLYANNTLTPGGNGTPPGVSLNRVVVGELVDNQTTFMIRTPGNIDIYGNDQITASFWANGRLTFHGTPDFTGNILSPEAHFAGNGDFTLTYAAPSSIITTPGYSLEYPMGPILIGYAEWADGLF